MKERTLMVAFSCAIGSGMGFLLAKEFGIFWILGILLGGFVGYMLYDYKNVITSIPIAFRYAVGEVEGQDFDKLKRNVAFVLNVIVAIVAIVIYPLFVCSFMIDEQSIDPVQLVAACFAVCMGFTNLSIFHKLDFIDNDKFIQKSLGIRKVVELTNKYNFIFILAIVFSPILAIYSCLKIALYDAVKFVITWTIKLFALTPPFLWKLFIQIHSQGRLIVGVDSVIGAFVGFYFFDNLWWGMATGVVLGVLNYEVVSVRILKLLPKSN